MMPTKRRRSRVRRDRDAARVQAAIRALRGALSEADDLGKLFGRFMALTELRGFIELGTFGISPKSTAVLDLAAAGLPGAVHTQISNLVPTWIAEHSLTHGSCRVGGRLAAFFFFDDLQQGLIGVHDGGSTMRFARLTLTQLPAGHALCPRPVGIN